MDNNVAKAWEERAGGWSMGKIKPKGDNCNIFNNNDKLKRKRRVGPRLTQKVVCSRD